MKKIVITCGLISGAIVSAMMAVSITICSSNPDFEGGSSMLIGYAAMVLAFSLIFVGIKMYRDKHNGGSVTLGKGFLIGLYIALIASTIYVAVWAIEYKYVFPDFMEKYSGQMIKKAQSSGRSQVKVDAEIKQMKMHQEMYKNPLFFTLITYAEILPLGIVISLLSALILKRRKNNDVVAVTE